MKSYFDDISRRGLMSYSELVKTYEQMEATQDEKIKRKLKQRVIEANLRLVLKEARKISQRTGIELADLVQEGNIGLMRAADKFDHTLGFRFSTYARHWIRQALGRYLSSVGRPVRLPGSAEVVAFKAQAALDSGAAIDVDSLSALLKKPRSAIVGSLACVSRHAVPLAAPGMSGVDVIDERDDPEETYSRAELIACMHDALANLSDEDRASVRTEFGV